MDELLFNFLLKILILFLLPLTVSGSRRELTVEVKILKLNFSAIFKLEEKVDIWGRDAETLFVCNDQTCQKMDNPCLKKVHILKSLSEGRSQH